MIEGSGKTLLPGLIDVHVHLGAPAGFYDSAEDYDPKSSMTRALAGLPVQRRHRGQKRGGRSRRDSETPGERRGRRAPRRLAVRLRPHVHG